MARGVNFGDDELTKSELEDILQNRTRAVFYKWAYVPMEGLSDYWWLIVRAKQSAQAIGRISVDLTGSVPRVYTRHPDPIERSLRALVLYPWLPEGARDGEGAPWVGFNIPFVLRVDDDLVSYPYGATPNSKVLDREPAYDSQTGEEDPLRTWPAVRFHLDEAETHAFRRFVQREEKRLSRLNQVEWSTALSEVGLGFLVKAFFAGGVEQLLWHLTTIEAVLGEDREGVTERLAQRLSRVLGATEGERKD